MAFTPDRPCFRYTVLLFNCLLTAGSYYCFDMPSVLETHLEDEIIAPFAKDDVSTYYNAFYTAYSWSNMVMSLIAGQMVDRLGTVKCGIIFLSMCLLGQALYAAGPMLAFDPATPKRYIVMFAGRVLFGLGGGAITIVQNSITAYWFRGHEMSFAFGMTLTVSRLGSVVNFDLSSYLYKTWNTRWPGYGLSATLFFGAGLIAISMLALVAYAALERSAQRYRDSLPDQPAKKKRVPLRCADVKALTGVFWLDCLCITAFYNMIFPFMADAKAYFESPKYGFTPTEAGVRASIVYTMSMVISPLMGGFVDWLGRRAHIAVFGTVLTVPAFYLFAATSVDPIYPMVMVGVSYSVCASALWPAIQLLVEERLVGTANGVATSMQMLGIGLCNIGVGALKDGYGANGYEAMCWFFLIMGSAASILAMSLLIADHAGRRVLFIGKRDKSSKGKGKGRRLSLESPDINSAPSERTPLIDVNAIS